MFRFALAMFAVNAVALPALIAWSWWRAKGESAISMVLQATVGLLFLAVFTLITNWSLVPVWLPPLMGLASLPFFVRLLWRAMRLPLLPPLTGRRVAALVFWAGCLTLLVLFVIPVVEGRYPDGAVDLDFPLTDPWYVLNGGPSLIENPHGVVVAQSYALDILGLNEWGARARGVLPEELERYAIFDDPVVAPCTGEVLAVEGEQVDRTPPVGDPEHAAGNHLLIACHDVTVLLAHLRQGSVLAEVGDKLESGAPVGRVGNSGNTTEPHLHIHAVSGRVPEIAAVLGSGKPVPMRFGGRSLRRHASSVWERVWD